MGCGASTEKSSRTSPAMPMSGQHSGAAVLRASGSSAELSVAFGAATLPHPQKDQDRFALRVHGGSTLLFGIFDGHSVHSVESGRGHAEAAARHCVTDLWGRTRKLVGREGAFEVASPLSEAAVASFTAHQAACEKRYEREVKAPVLRKKSQLEAEIGEELPLELPQEGGTTATVGLVHPAGLLIAWVGDSRALLCRREAGYKVGPIAGTGLKTTSLTRDHNLDDQHERERLLRAGGKTMGRESGLKSVSVAGVEGSLKVTRSLGDSPFHKGDAVSATPSVAAQPLGDDARFVVVASDGVWDHFSNERVAQIVDGALTAHARDSAERACAAACAAVLDEISLGQQNGDLKDHVDDKSIIVVQFDAEGERRRATEASSLSQS